MITQSYNLNMIPGGVPVRVPVSQYDADSRGIVFNLYSGDSEFTVPGGAVVTCDGTKPDRKGVSILCSYSGSAVTVTVTEQMAAVAGNADYQLTVTKDGAVLGSANFVLAVEKAALGDDTDISESEMSALAELSRQTAESAQKAQEVLSGINEAQDDLDAAITAAGTAQGGLETTISAANTANTNLTNATTTADTARTNLSNATTAANTAKSDLEAAVTAAETAEDSLEAATTAANTAKTALDAANETAEDNLAALSSAEAMAQKMPLVPTATSGNLAAFNASGGVEDSGKAPGDFAPAGLVVKTIETSTDDELDSALTAEINDTSFLAYTARYYWIRCTSTASALGGAHWLALISKMSTSYGTIAAQSYIGQYGVRELRRSWYGAVLHPWEFVNPPLFIGVEYRTIERYNGAPVCKELLNIGVLAAGTTTSVAHGATFSQCIGCDLIDGDGVLTHRTSFIKITTSDIIVTLPSGTGGRTTYAILSYVK